MRRTVLFTLCVVLTACSLSASIGYKPVFGPGTHPCDRLDTAAKADLFVAGLAATVGSLVLISLAGDSHVDSGGALVLPAAAGLVALVWGSAGVYGLHERNECRGDERIATERTRAETAARARREQAWKLTEEAEAAARRDDCARVAALDPQIASLDAGMHDTVFARDAAISRCLSAP